MSGWVRNFKDLFWCLTKFIDLKFYRISFNGVCNWIKIHCSFICQVVEHWDRGLGFFSKSKNTIVSFNSFFTLLFVSKDQINPVMKIFWYIITLQSLSIDAKEIFAVFCPFWKFNILKNELTKLNKYSLRYINSFAILTETKIKLLVIDQKAVIIFIKFWDQFFWNCIIIDDILNRIYDDYEFSPKSLRSNLFSDSKIVCLLYQTFHSIEIVGSNSQRNPFTWNLSMYCGCFLRRYPIT